MLRGKTCYLKIIENGEWALAYDVFRRPDVWPTIVADPAEVFPSNFAGLLMPNIPVTQSRAFGIWLKQAQETPPAPDRLVGFCSLNEIRFTNGSCRAGTFGVAVEEGQPPVALDAMRLLMSHAFDDLRLNRIEALCWADNLAIQRLYKTIGLKVDGLLREAFFRNGRYIDAILYSILRSDVEGTAAVQPGKAN